MRRLCTPDPDATQLGKRGCPLSRAPLRPCGAAHEKAGVRRAARPLSYPLPRRQYEPGALLLATAQTPLAQVTSRFPRLCVWRPLQSSEKAKLCERCARECVSLNHPKGSRRRRSLFFAASLGFRKRQDVDLPRWVVHLYSEKAMLRENTRGQAWLRDGSAPQGTSSIPGSQRATTLSSSSAWC
jgi:hypothetical protein